jgi:hypothetical protein
LKFGEKVYKNLKLEYIGELEFAYKSHSEENISSQKTNSIFDGEKITINLLKSGENIYSNVILILIQITDLAHNPQTYRF